MATLVDLAGPAFRSSGSKRVVAGSLGVSVADLREEIAEAIPPASRRRARRRAPPGSRRLRSPSTI
jgi:hypothetical protein